MLLQVPEQQQDQRVGVGVSGPPGLHPAGAQTEQEPDRPGPGTGLPAARPHPAVSTRHAGFIYAVVKTTLTQEAGLGSLLLKGNGAKKIISVGERKGASDCNPILQVSIGLGRKEEGKVKTR